MSSKSERRRKKKAARKGRKTVTVRNQPKATNDRSRHLEAIQEAQRRLRRERELQQLELTSTLRRVPELEEVIHAVNQLLDVSDPRKAAPISAGSPSSDPDMGPDGIAVIGHGKDQIATPRYATDSAEYREAVAWLQRLLGRTATKILNRVGGDPGIEKMQERPPRCQKTLPAGHPARTLPDDQTEKCPMYGRTQPWEATVCAGCGAPFGRRK